MSAQSVVTRLIISASVRLYRESLQSLFSSQPHIELVGVVSDTTEVPPLVRSEQPTTILIDTRVSPTEAARQLRSIAPDYGLLFLVDEYDLGAILTLLQAGATGCISRDALLGELARAIIAVGRGEIALPATIAAQALAALASGRQVGDDSLRVEDLTERETDVLGLLAEGMSNKDIAQALIVSVRTVEAHLRSIYAKLGVHSRTEAALWAVTSGYGRQKQVE